MLPRHGEGRFSRALSPVVPGRRRPSLGRETYEAWAGGLHSLRTGSPALSGNAGPGFFAWLQERPENQRGYQTAMASYARHDYNTLAHAVDLSGQSAMLDAGGGTGELAFALLRAYPN